MQIKSIFRRASTQSGVMKESDTNNFKDEYNIAHECVELPRVLL